MLQEATTVQFGEGLSGESEGRDGQQSWSQPLLTGGAETLQTSSLVNSPVCITHPAL